MYRTVSASTTIAAVTVPELSDRSLRSTEAASTASLKFSVIDVGTPLSTSSCAGLAEVTAMAT